MACSPHRWAQIPAEQIWQMWQIQRCCGGCSAAPAWSVWSWISDLDRPLHRPPRWSPCRTAVRQSEVRSSDSLSDHVLIAMGRGFPLVHDNIQPHVAGVCQHFLDDEDIDAIDWPARSSDPGSNQAPLGQQISYPPLPCCTVDCPADWCSDPGLGGDLGSGISVFYYLLFTFIISLKNIFTWWLHRFMQF